MLAMMIGTALGFVLPEWGVRVLKTFEVFVTVLLKFMVPLVILGLVTAAIVEAGRNSGKMLIATFAFVIVSVIASGYFALGASVVTYPCVLPETLANDFAAMTTAEPYFKIAIPPPLDIMTTLALAVIGGLAARHFEKVWMFRQPEERSARDWDLGRNLAVRCGDIAMIGLDTGEDKLDSRDVFAGLFNMEPYRIAQTTWLRDVLESSDIRETPFIVAFCHIPLYNSDPKANPGDVEKDGNGKYSTDFANWQRACAKMWGPLLERAGCQLVVAAHQHRYRYDKPNAEHTWAHLVGGGPEFGVRRRKVDGKIVMVPDDGKYPTVIDGVVEDGHLHVRVHDVLNGRIVGDFMYEPRSMLSNR